MNPLSHLIADQLAHAASPGTFVGAWSAHAVRRQLLLAGGASGVWPAEQPQTFLARASRRLWGGNCRPPSCGIAAGASLRVCSRFCRARLTSLCDTIAAVRQHRRSALSAPDDGPLTNFTNLTTFSSCPTFTEKLGIRAQLGPTVTAPPQTWQAYQAHPCAAPGPLRPPRQPRCPPVLPALSSLLIS